jgi:hypothetical protein
VKFLIAAITVRSGGPEALHQLAHTLTKLGIDSSIIYLFEANGKLIASKSNENQYPEYDQIRVVTQPSIDDNTVLILPEIWANHALTFADSCNVLVWWLSVDNGLLSLGKIAHTLDKYRSHPQIIHAYQSSYAREFLNSLGLNQNNLPLSDFTKGVTKASSIKTKKQQKSWFKYATIHPKEPGLPISLSSNIPTQYIQKLRE